MLGYRVITALAVGLLMLGTHVLAAASQGYGEYYYNDQYCSGEGGDPSYCTVPLEDDFDGYTFYEHGVTFYYSKDFWDSDYGYYQEAPDGTSYPVFYPNWFRGYRVDQYIKDHPLGKDLPGRPHKRGILNRQEAKPTVERRQSLHKADASQQRAEQKQQRPDVQQSGGRSGQGARSHQGVRTHRGGRSSEPGQ